MLLRNLIQVTESISGSVVPLAMFFESPVKKDPDMQNWVHKMTSDIISSLLSISGALVVE